MKKSTSIALHNMLIEVKSTNAAYKVIRGWISCLLSADIEPTTAELELLAISAELDLESMYGIEISGFGMLMLASDLASESGLLFVTNIILVDPLDKILFESSAYFWYDYLPSIAKQHMVDLDQLRYICAAYSVLDKLRYDDDQL